jgi:hypothetical protein
MSVRAFFRRNRARPDNSACMLVLATAVLACAPEGSLGSDRPAGTDSGGATAAQTGTEGTGTAGTADGTADDAASASTAASSTGPSSSGGSDEGSTDDGSTGAVDACVPDAADSPCTTCLKGHCCAEQTACQASEPCTCIDACIADGGEAVACVEHCGGPDDDWTHLHDCGAKHCIDAC